MAGLPRELLKWLQSLDLSYAVKNIKRDFSNGFLVAEIFSRYYVQDVEMHSYDNGQSLQRKLDNWAQLSKFFAKRDIKIDRDVIDSVVHCKSSEAPARLIATIYTQLTGREVRAPMRVPNDMAGTGMDATDLPGFARPNATSLLASNMKESEMTTTLLDKSVASDKAKSIVDQHAEALRKERTVEPSRFAGGGASNASYHRMLRGPPKPVSQEVDTAQVRFQEVKVKPVDRNIAQLRQSRDAQLAGGMSYASTAPGSVVPGAAAASATPGPDVLQMFGELLLADTEIAALLGFAQADSPPPDAAFQFLERMPQMPSQACVRLFAAACGEAKKLAAACASSPMQGWQLFSLLGKALATASAPDVFSAASALLVQVGIKMTASDAALAEGLMRDFGMPKLLPLLKAQPERAPTLLRAVYAFCLEEPSAHISVIKALQDGLSDQGVFLHALTSLIGLEKRFNEDLLDLYIYYCVIALATPSCRLRAAAIGMLTHVAAAQPSLVLQMLPRLESLLADPWWQVQAAIGRVSCTLLSHPLEPTVGAKVTSMLLSVLANRSPSVACVVLSETAPLLSVLPALLAPFLDALLALPSAQRSTLLQLSADPLALPLVSGEEHALKPLAGSWPALAVAQELLKGAKAMDLETLERPHAEVIAALLMGPFDAAETPAWREWLLTNKDYLYVSLCDEELCAMMTAALLSLFRLLQEAALPTFATLLSSLRMLSAPETPQVCQTVAMEFLSQLHELGEPFTGAIVSLVKNFDAPMRTTLAELVSRVEG